MSETYITVPVSTLREWKRLLKSGEAPLVPFNKDEVKMLRDAYDLRGGVITVITNQIANLNVPDAGDR